MHLALKSGRRMGRDGRVDGIGLSCFLNGCIKPPSWGVQGPSSSLTSVRANTDYMQLQSFMHFLSLPRFQSS